MTEGYSSTFVHSQQEAKPPVILVHGIDARDKGNKASKHWGRIPKALRAQGYPVYFADQDAWGSVSSNAKQISQVIENVYGSHGNKVIIVAHSKGGLDCLEACSYEGISEKVSKLITLSSPHKGMGFCDRLANHKVIIGGIAAPFVNVKASIWGDKAPDSFKALCCLGTSRAHEPSVKASVKLISVGFRSAQPKGIVGRAVRRSDGPNDGLVALGSTECGDWRIVDIASDHAFTHTDCIDKDERDIPLILDGVRYGSIVDLVVALVEDGES